MEVDFDEGVELVVNLRYEKLYGFCTECSCMTHEKAKCPALVAVSEENPVVTGSSEQGLQAISYKTAATLGRAPSENQGVMRDGKDRGKGKGIMRENYGANRGFRDRGQRGVGDGFSRGGRRYGQGGAGRFVGNQNGSQAPKLMGDALKESSALEDPSLAVKQPKVRRSLQFEEPVGEVGSSSVLNNPTFEDPPAEEDVSMKEGAVVEGDEQVPDLDAENLMMEGVILSDSELLDEAWEEGEIPEDFEEEQAENVGRDAPGTGAVLDEIKEAAKAAKKKVINPAAFGGSTKKRLVQNLLSPRKNKVSKVPGKGGDKGNGQGDGKKGQGRAKEGTE